MPNLTPIEWVRFLEPKLRAREVGLQKLDDYYRGEHPLPFLTKSHNAKMVNEFRRLLDESSTNFMRLVVDVVEERLNVEGIRLSSTSDAETDQESWQIWQANHMDSEASMAITDSLVKGVSYLSVWEAGEEDEYPVIAVEDACECIVYYTPGSGYRYRDAALKLWYDGDEKRANVYLPDAIHKFRAGDDTANRQANQAAYYLGNLGYGSLTEAAKWEEIPGSMVENPIGIVPIVPLRNRPRVKYEGESELADVWKTQNQINGFLFLLALGGYFGAHKQRWAAGVPIMLNEAGQPIEPFESDVSKLWAAEDKDVKFGEFSQTDLDGYIKAIEQKVLHIAVTTRTPRHYLIESGQSPSGDAIKSAESGLVKKAERKMRSLGEGFEEALVLARRFQGEEDAPVDSEIVWSDPATPTEAETTDAVIKKYEAKLIPWEQAMEDLGYTQTQIARMAGMRQADALNAALAQPLLPPAPTTPPAPPAPAPPPEVPVV